MEGKTSKCFEETQNHDTIDTKAAPAQAQADAASGSEPKRQTSLENPITGATDMSEGAFDMSKLMRERAIINGKVQWITGTSKQELFQAYLDRAIEEGVVTVPGEDGPTREPILFKDVARRWFKLYKVGKVRETTLTGYESYLRRHMLPFFGERDVRDITIDDVQIFLNEKAELSRKTIEETWLVVRMVRGVAYEDQIISINPAKSKRLRNPSRRKSVREPLTSREAQDIAEHLADIPKLIDRRFVALLLYCPARSEDIRGIQMRDIDPQKMLIRIRQSVTYANSRTVIGDPKTEAGFRHMLTLPKLWEALALTEEEMSDPEAYLIHMKDDPRKPLSFQANRRLWERVEQVINVYGKTPHCFRHTFATRAYRAGMPEKTLQTMGGWADRKTMQDVYIHTRRKTSKKRAAS